jgi:uncharacterized protein (DUF2249 family)
MTHNIPHQHTHQTVFEHIHILCEGVVFEVGVDIDSGTLEARISHIKTHIRCMKQEIGHSSQKTQE